MTNSVKYVVKAKDYGTTIHNDIESGTKHLLKLSEEGAHRVSLIKVKKGYRLGEYTYYLKLRNRPILEIAHTWLEVKGALVFFGDTLENVYYEEL